MYHIRKNARYRKMEVDFCNQKKVDAFSQKRPFRGQF